MQLIGVNRSPYTRRVAITLEAYGLPFEQRDLSGFGNRGEVRAANPLGRIPALVLDDGETLVDSAAIVDHLDEIQGRDRALTPPAGAERRADGHGAGPRLPGGVLDDDHLEAALREDDVLGNDDRLPLPGVDGGPSGHARGDLASGDLDLDHEGVAGGVGPGGHLDHPPR